MKKTLLVALALVALPLAGCADNETVEAVTPATDAPVVEEPAVVAEPVEGLDATMTEEPALDAAPATEEAPVAPVEGETEDGTTM